MHLRCCQGGGTVRHNNADFNFNYSLGGLITDIESALQKIDEIKSNQEGIAAEEASILRGCVPLSYKMFTF